MADILEGRGVLGDRVKLSLSPFVIAVNEEDFRPAVVDVFSEDVGHPILLVEVALKSLQFFIRQSSAESCLDHLSETIGFESYVSFNSMQCQRLGFLLVWQVSEIAFDSFGRQKSTQTEWQLKFKHYSNFTECLKCGFSLDVEFFSFDVPFDDPVEVLVCSLLKVLRRSQLESLRARSKLCLEEVTEDSFDLLVRHDC